MKVKALSCNVYHSPYGDCTNGGISAKPDDLYLAACDPDQDLPEKGLAYAFGMEDFADWLTWDLGEDDLNNRTLVLVKRTLGGKPCWYAAPLYSPPGMYGPMFGGNFLWTSDSRFPTAAPLPIHDRFETPEQYEQLSR